MREIEFRAWDKEMKRYLYSDPAHPKTGYVIDSNTGKGAYEHGRFHTQGIGIQLTLTGEVFKACYYDTASFVGYPLEQYTGVKDKNGKKIFENDIVRVNDKLRIIEWRGSGFVCSGTEYGLDTCFFVGGAPVVVGNVLENPELCVK
jgi:hypothetical protein